jgi:dipeptidyl aminopeptidase/acylaminoacyl peptidase
MAQAKRSMTVEDLFRIVVVGNPQTSPDGTRLAWVQSQADQELDGYRSAIWVADANGGNPRQLTSGRDRDSDPRWSPDGRTVAFVSTRKSVVPSSETPPSGESEPGTTPQSFGKPKSQVWTIAIDGGEAIQRTAHPNGAESPAWSPDGTTLAFIATDVPSDEDRFAAPTLMGPIADERVVQSVSYRFDGQGFLERFGHIWLVDITSGASTQLTYGPANDGNPVWSPDGKSIAFVGNRTLERSLKWNRQLVYRLDLESGDITALTPEDGRFGSPAWSPDGKTIAFTGHLGTGSYLIDRVWTVSAAGDDLRCLTEGIDLEFGDSGMSDVALGGNAGPIWSGANELLVLASTRGETQVHAVNVSESTVTPVTTGQHRISGIALSGEGLVVARGTIAAPFELARQDTRDSSLMPVSSANAELMAEAQLSHAIDLEVTSPDGTAIQGWIIPPAGADLEGSAQSPVIVQIHGGPHSMYGYALFHEMQLMAAKGYAVAFCNPRGSAGYGQEFLSSTRGAWGESDMPDIIALTESVVALPWIDTNRLGITGGSYGGYLTNWVVGHDDRFRAAVTQRCVSSFLSFFGTSDIGTTFGVDEFGGVPWTDFEKLRKHSPISYVDRIATPLLILHSEQDLRCPIEQAEQMYAALAYLGQDVGFVRFPEEGHELSRAGTPSRRLARLHHLIGWFDQKL